MIELLGDDDTLHIQSGDFVYKKYFISKSSLETWWDEVYQVLLTNLCTSKL